MYGIGIRTEEKVTVSRTTLQQQPVCVLIDIDDCDLVLSSEAAGAIAFPCLIDAVCLVPEELQHFTIELSTVVQRRDQFDPHTVVFLCFRRVIARERPSDGDARLLHVSLCVVQILEELPHTVADKLGEHFLRAWVHTLPRVCLGRGLMEIGGEGFEP